MDPARLYDAELAGLIEPGERLSCVVMASYFPGEEREGPLPGVSFDVATGLSVGAWDAAAERLVAGVSLSGPPGSLAQGMRAAFDPFGGDANHVALTDRRLIAVRLASGEGKPAWQADRAALAGVWLKPRLFQRGRVLLGFRDASMLCLVTGMLRAGEARRLAAAAA